MAAIPLHCDYMYNLTHRPVPAALPRLLDAVDTITHTKNLLKVYKHQKRNNIQFPQGTHFIQKLGDVIYLIVNDYPAGVLCLVFLNFVPSNDFVHT